MEQLSLGNPPYWQWTRASLQLSYCGCNVVTTL